MSDASTSSDGPHSASGPTPFKYWTKDEQYNLYLGLKHHGYNIKELHKQLPTKTEEEIRAAIDYFKKELISRNESSTNLRNRHKRKTKPEPQIPLAKWADVMTETYDYHELQTECSTAVRIIADFEHFPMPSLTEDIDFRKIYHYIADAMEGKPLPDDPLAADILNHCIMESALMSKLFIPKNELHDILGVFYTVHGAGSGRLPRPTKDGGLAALRHIAMQEKYNPLCIPEQYLKHHDSYTTDGGSAI